MHIYLDNAATTPLDPQVLEAMLPYMTEHFGNPSSIHALGRKTKTAIERARRTVAQHLNASIGEIFFMSSGTEANNMVLRGAVRDLGVQHIITSPLEHHAVLHTVQALEKECGIQVHFIPFKSDGHINVVELDQLLRNIPSPKLVSLMHGNNEIGNLLDLVTVSEICQEQNAYFHTDAVQTFGYYPFDVQALKISFLTASAHKFYGPKGVGFLYINGDNFIEPIITGGAQERTMRAGTENVYGIVGLAKATEIAYANLTKDKTQITLLKHYLISELEQHIPNLTFNGDVKGASHYKVVNASFPPDIATDLLLLNLDIAGICASGGSACSSGVDLGSHVLDALNIDPNRINVRFSLSKYNTRKEIDTLILRLQEILKLNGEVSVING